MNGDLNQDGERKYGWLEYASPQTCREWGSYLYIFGIGAKPPEFWKGKEILDVGSGEKFDDPSQSFPEATVRAIDPHFENIHNSAHEKKTGIG